MPTKLENNDHSITVALNKMSLDEMEQIRDRMTKVIDDAKESDKNEADVLEAVKRLEETTNMRVAIKRTAYNRPPKYQYKDADGEWQTWAGVGKTPKALKDKITVNGVEDRTLLEKYLIDKGDNAVYQFRDETGQVKTWSGKGKTPKALQHHIDKGYKLDQFKVKEH